MAIRIGVYGFKHGHIQSAVKAWLKLPNVEVVCAEDDPHYREAAAESLGFPVLNTTGEQFLEGEEMDVFATGDAYGNRGRLLNLALDKGCHIFGDKPLCTRLSELEELGPKLRDSKQAACLMLTLRYRPAYVELRRWIRQGLLGDICSMYAFGPHPLNYGTRPNWYFKPELHGGILNDLMCHGIDFMRWLSGLEMAQVLHASVGNVAAYMAPEFEDIGDCVCLFEKGARFGGEVSYLSPPQGQAIGWVFVGWGTAGQFKIETHGNVLAVDVAGQGPAELTAAPLEYSNPAEDFVAFLETGHPPLITTDDVLRTSICSLLVQDRAQRI